MNNKAWQEKTQAKTRTLSELRNIIKGGDKLAIGLAGFSGNFDTQERPDIEQVIQQIIEYMLHEKMESCLPQQIFMVSGATKLGVPQVGYTVARKLGISSIGLTANEAIDHPIAEIDYLTVVGEQFGDESEAFISIIDELWVIGGGEQSLKECKMAVNSETPVKIIQGLGGIADSHNSQVLEATYINVDQYIEQNDAY